MSSHFDLPPSLLRHVGAISKIRTLSIRQGREVLLVEDSQGQWRIFKIYRNLNSAEISRYIDIRQRLSQVSPGVHLLRVLAFEVEDGLFWDELPLADPDNTSASIFENYNPVHPDCPNPFSKEQSLKLILSVGSAVCSALVDLASIDFCHGDVKRSNILRINGLWVLGDLDTVGPASTFHNPTASTEGYVPPGDHDRAQRDCYALGKLFYELWTGSDRLEYPTIPTWLMKSPWNRCDRLINDTICSLCSPFGSHRLGNVEVVKEVLRAIEQNDPHDLRNAESLVRRQNRFNLFKPALGLLLAFLLCFALYFQKRSRPLWDGHPVVFCSFSNPEGMNTGYARWGSDGIRPTWMLFNTHATLSEPIETDSVFEISLKKEIWRGHIGLYISEKPFYSLHEHWLSHREHFGGIDHMLFFHVDGDSLVGPSIFKSGKEVSFPESNWSQNYTTNTLAPYRIELTVLENQYLWNISSGKIHLATGTYKRDSSKLEYLNVYTYDNTLCYLSELKIRKLSNPRMQR